jgi:uncharacterized protein (DUF362 family)
MTVNDSFVSVVKIDDFSEYPAVAPFDPSSEYPELSNNSFYHINRKYKNYIYDAVRKSLANLGLDKDHFNTDQWSPFRSMISQNDIVLIKPNLVLDTENPDAVTTHSSVIRPIVDYAWKALGGRGKIIICDAPQADADFDKIISMNGLKDMITILKERGLNIEVEDLRALTVRIKNDIWIEETEHPVNRKDSVIIDLGNKSFFNDKKVNIKKLFGAGYNRRFTVSNHSRGHHKYCISKKVLEADIIISVPKIKTHTKAGLTCCLKNFVGINVDKNYLPHFTIGPANTGGDEFPLVSRWRVPLVLFIRYLQEIIQRHLWIYTRRLIAFILGSFNLIKIRKIHHRSNEAGPAYQFYKLITGKTNYQGSWQGNETIWRMILDLNRIVLYCDKNGKLQNSNQRKLFFIVDGFFAGSRNGPMIPLTIKPGICLAGFNGAMVDSAVLKIFGIDFHDIPLYREALDVKNDWLHFNGELVVVSNGNFSQEELFQNKYILEPPDNWNFERI